jgi:hypothetical protein
MKLYKTHKNERGAISGAQVTIVGLAVLVLGLGSFGIWAFVSYSDAKDNVDSKISVAVAEAKNEEGKEQEEKFAEREKNPLETFVGPSDYCRLTFQYSKKWSVYEAKSVTNGGDYEAYLNPKVVPPLDSDQIFALRVYIDQKDYDTVLDSYQALVKKSELKYSETSSEGSQGARFTGKFTKNIRGDAVIYKCRDKTITIRTDSDAFKDDFEKLIKTIEFNT